ncbi:hypothetical protein K8089_03765 [Aequorivita sp. F47161]|uniref:GLPGLI family protein n=1 Tax=Aequorivita vitellina TaxID=2874475 RepID=A0A9X1U2D3_9FLAO|nr:hypothetical protein [Aequorivita vitellina]MCG2418127.1 hypothetical protein [Aequorivita vitellina]
MIKNIILILVVLLSSICAAQDFELRATPYVKCKIVYKDNSSEKGFLRFASSAFSPQFKKDENEKSKKIDFELIEKIISNPDTENERIFQYLNHNYNKFKIFVELIYSDVLSIYISSTDSDDLFYSDFDRQNIREMMDQAKFEGLSGFTKRLKMSDTLNLPNGKKIKLPIKYLYYYNLNYGIASGTRAKLNYYLMKNDSQILYKVEKNKRFIRKSIELFNDCPTLLNDLKQDKINLFNLAKFIEYYKDECGN